jgi:phage gp29-like protein
MNDKKVLWLNESHAIELAEAEARPVAEEIATRARCDYFSMLASLPDPDLVLRRMGHDMRIYEEQLTDPHVGACMARRKAGTKKRLWEIDRGDAKSKHAKFIEEIFNQRSFKLKQAISEILDCVYYGFQPLEITWTPDGNSIIPTAITAKPPRWFAFSQQNELLLRTKQNYWGEPIPDKKFLLAQYEPRYENPYGRRIAAQIFWYALFKKNGLKWWVTFVEKFGIPYIVAKNPRGSGQALQDDLLNMCAKMIRDAIAVIPDDSSVEILSAKENAGQVPQHQMLIDFCDKSISKAFLGHSAAADSTPGKLGGESDAMSATDDIIDADSDLVMGVMNDLIDWTVEVNFGAVDVRPRFVLYDEEKVDAALATRDKTLSDIGNVKFTKEYFVKAYGFDEEDLDVVTPSGQPNPPPAPGSTAADAGLPGNDPSLPPPPQKPYLGVEMADGTGGFQTRPDSAGPGSVPARAAEDQKSVDEMLDGITADDLQKQIEGPLKPVIDLIEGAASYDAVMEKIARCFPAMDDKKFQDTLAKAMFLAEVKGRLSAAPVKAK